MTSSTSKSSRVSVLVIDIELEELNRQNYNQLDLVGKQKSHYCPSVSNQKRFHQKVKLVKPTLLVAIGADAEISQLGTSYSSFKLQR